ncbi:DUF4097 family beta strand repeat-containing protein [Paenibacillus cremeus]|uniref:DUF4097 domain-containing protein n=1 Tax=Paenibacillus cremeus TaxID=2163881 RepID=A0A559K4I6_9BACL|nr:DUF4097 family beta strand repeat-containing protein [Paenibacillus cremeus]TVY07017.1 DUF4097 domain-containing protein [Paenibacillus cremeus]
MSRIVGIIAMLFGFILLVLSMPDHWPTWGVKVERAPIHSVQEVQIDTSDVDVHIVEEDREDLAVTLEGNTEVKLTPQGTGLGILITRKPLSLFPCDAVAVIHLPQTYGRNISIAANHGEVTLAGLSEQHKLGLKRLNVRVDHGELALTDVTLEDLQFAMDKGRLLIRQSSLGNSTMKIQSGKVDLNKVNGRLYTELSTGVFEADSVTSDNAELTVGKGDISLSQFTGDWNASLSAGHMIVKGGSGGKGVVTIDKGDFNLASFKGKLETTINKGNMNISDFSGDFKSSIINGNFNAQRMMAGEGVIDAGNGKINISDYTGGLQADLQKGQINIGLKEAVKAIEVKAASGDITFGLPPNGDFTIDASAVKGMVDNGSRLSNTGGAGNNKTLHAISGQGVVPIRLNSNDGDIHIHSKGGSDSR